MTRFSRFAWLIPLVIYFSAGFYQLDLPGLHYDEAFEAVPALQLLRNQPVTTFRDHGLVVGGQRFPLMTQDYIGAINTYLALPFIAIAGPTPAALRTMTLLAGGITLWLAYLLAAHLTGQRWAGGLAALLLAVDPTFVFWNRQGIFVTSVTAPIGLAATLCWWRYFQHRSIRWAVAGSFLFGLGLYAKFLFLWLIAALIGAALLMNMPELINAIRRKHRLSWPVPPLKNVWLMISGFLLGCWPLLIYNLQTGGTFLNITQNADTSYYGVDNLAIGANLLERIRQFGVMVNGSHLWYLGDIWSTPLPSLLLLGLLLVVACMTTRSILRQNQTPDKANVALFPFLVMGGVIITSIGTVSALWVTHFALLMPWPAIAIALSSWFILRHTRAARQRLTLVTLAVLLLLLTGSQLMNTLAYHRSLDKSGGLSTHSDAIYDLSDWLRQNTAGPVAAMDWGLAAPVTYLTAGRITPVEVFGYAWESDRELAARLKSLISRPNTLYLWRAPDEIIFDRSQMFKTLYRPLDLEENIEAAFYERSGRPLLGITRLVPAGTAENAPQ